MSLIFALHLEYGKIIFFDFFTLIKIWKENFDIHKNLKRKLSKTLETPVCWKTVSSVFINFQSFIGSAQQTWLGANYYFDVSV